MKDKDLRTQSWLRKIISYPFKPNHSKLSPLIPDKEFIFKVKNLGELKQRLRKNLKLEEPIRFFYCQK